LGLKKQGNRECCITRGCIVVLVTRCWGEVGVQRGVVEGVHKVLVIKSMWQACEKRSVDSGIILKLVFRKLCVGWFNPFCMLLFLNTWRT
jgi:hypothetical protein